MCQSCPALVPDDCISVDCTALSLIEMVGKYHGSSSGSGDVVQGTADLGHNLARPKVQCNVFLAAPFDGYCLIIHVYL